MSDDDNIDVSYQGIIVLRFQTLFHKFSKLMFAVIIVESLSVHIKSRDNINVSNRFS